MARRTPAPIVASEPPPAVLEELHGLSGALDAAIPAKQVDRNLLIGTWNIRAFGDLTEKWEAGPHDEPKRDLRAARYIAEIVSRFDVCAIQEVKDNIKALRHVLKVLGPDWGFVLTDVVKGPSGNNERLAFVFDTRRAKPSGLACELVVPPERRGTGKGKIRPDALKPGEQFARTPYAVSFTSAGRTFILITLHVIWGKDSKDRVGELTSIAEWLGNWAGEVAEWNQNLLCLGDFNIDRKDDALFRAFTSTGLHAPLELDKAPRTINKDTGQFYDQIAWFDKRLTLGYSGHAGTFDFRGHVFHEIEGAGPLSWEMSDHLPLWAEFSVRPAEAAGRRFAREEPG